MNMTLLGRHKAHVTMLESIAKECEDEGKSREKIKRFLLFEKVKRTS